MSNVKIVLDEAGILEFLKSGEVKDFISGVAENCVSSCSGNYKVENTVKSGRAVSYIKTADNKTYYKNLKTNELIKATSPNKTRK